MAGLGAIARIVGEKKSGVFSYLPTGVIVLFAVIGVDPWQL